MASLKFYANREISFALFADVTGEGWTQLTAAGETARGYSTRLRTALVGAAGGTCTAEPCELTPRTGADTTLSCRVTLRPGRDVDSTALDRAILAELNRGAPSGVRWVEHVSATGYGGAGAVAALGAPLLVPLLPVIGLVGLVSSDAREYAAEQFRGVAGLVIDPSTVRQGSDRSPVGASSSALGRAATVVTGGPVASTDPARDGRTPSDRAREELPGVPGWLLVVGGVAGVLVALGVVGYAARGIAQVAREA
jgi:hypothetical protein